MINTNCSKTKTKEKENEPTERQKSPQIDPEEFKEVSSLIGNDNGNGDEYIFHNGKMVKRSVLLREMNMTDDALNQIDALTVTSINSQLQQYEGEIRGR